MKKGKMIIFTLLMTLVMTLFVTGCANKKEELVFDSKEGSFTLSVDHSAGYKISTDSKDFRSSREQAMLIGKDFSIGIEFNDDFPYNIKMFGTYPGKMYLYDRIREVTRTRK